MKEANINVSQKLRLGRRQLEAMRRFLILKDFEWNQRESRWILSCRLTIANPSKNVPRETDWFILVSNNYPYGDIQIFPSKQNGLNETFHHMAFNSPGVNDTPWRLGALCLDTSVRALGRQAYDDEPFSAEERLKWRVERAILWLEKASSGKLVVRGEPFELPVFPPGLLRPIVAFSESRNSLIEWNQNDIKIGYVSLCHPYDKQDYFAVREFKSLGGNVNHEVNWGHTISNQPINEDLGIWLRLSDIPVFAPFRTPQTWGELIEACEDKKVDILEELKILLKQIRKSNKYKTILLLGFPIPDKVGGKASKLFWKPILLPELSKKPIDGFPPNDEGLWRKDVKSVFTSERRLDWLPSENWNFEDLNTRGSLPKEIREKRFVLIGAGALGSEIAQLLVRDGVYKLLVVDGETFVPGNATRHVLDQSSIGINKAEALASKLNYISPNATINYSDNHFPPPPESDVKPFIDADVVIDSTASDEVIYQLEKFQWLYPKSFFSVSLSLRANRVFFFASKGYKFSGKLIMHLLAPFLEKERAFYHLEELPREYTGCWHPITMARAEDITLAASIIIKQIENDLITESQDRFLVLEKQKDGYGYKTDHQANSSYEESTDVFLRQEVWYRVSRRIASQIGKVMQRFWRK